MTKKKTSAKTTSKKVVKGDWVRSNDTHGGDWQWKNKKTGETVFMSYGKGPPKRPIKITSKKKPVGFDPLLLEAALYKAEDDFDKAVCRFMLVGKTLKSIKENFVIGGTKVELAVLERRLTKEVRGWFKEWGWKFTKTKMTIEFKGIPIEVKIIKNVKRPYKDPDVMHYKVAYYEIPNPWRLGL